jgi:hypothetical protein
MEERHYRKTFMSRLINALLWIERNPSAFTTASSFQLVHRFARPDQRLALPGPAPIDFGLGAKSIADTVSFIKAGQQPHRSFFSTAAVIPSGDPVPIHDDRPLVCP